MSRRSSSTGTPSRSMPPGQTRSSSGSPRIPGEPARPLAKIASGGELSRVALAVKQVLAAADDTPTLVFDEVDAGIGGRSADPLGRSLWALARSHQVLVVTHLPQIAAHADAHFRIAKRERDGRTVTEVVRLDREGRIVELAAMLGGIGEGGPGTAALASARELLDAADAWRGRPVRRRLTAGRARTGWAADARPGDRGLPHLPPRRARSRGGDAPGVPGGPRRLRRRPGHEPRLGARPGRGGSLPRRAHEARPAHWIRASRRRASGVARPPSAASTSSRSATA